MERPKRYCRFKGCTNTDKTRGIHFYRFPKQEKRCKAWVKACKNEKLTNAPVSDLYKNAYLCMDHFEDWCFMNITKKHRLVHNAVPCCSKSSLIEDPVSDDEVSSNSIQTDSNSSILQHLLMSTIPSQASNTSINKNNVTIVNLQNVKRCSKTTEDQTMSSSSESISDVSAIPSVTIFKSENSNMPVDVQSSNIASVSNTNSNNLNAYKDISVLEVDSKPLKSVAVSTEVTIQQLNEQDNEIYTLREKLRLAKRALTICKDKIRELERVNKKLIGMS